LINHSSCLPPSASRCSIQKDAAVTSAAILTGKATSAELLLQGFSPKIVRPKSWGRSLNAGQVRVFDPGQAADHVTAADHYQMVVLAVDGDLFRQEVLVLGGFDQEERLARKEMVTTVTTSPTYAPRRVLLLLALLTRHPRRPEESVSLCELLAVGEWSEYSKPVAGNHCEPVETGGTTGQPQQTTVLLPRHERSSISHTSVA
jgi:hypothetical protein